jgi:hypothetical protein
LHHGLRDNYNGARSLYARMWNNLDMFRPAYEGLDVDTFMTRMQNCCTPALEGRPIDSKTLPIIALTP